jgi:acyl-coenzyme A synthetase/AMP-(fatty) acid ligase
LPGHAEIAGTCAAGLAAFDQVLGLFLGGLALLRSTDYQWWAFVLLILVPALLSGATLALMEGRSKTTSI